MSAAQSVADEDETSADAQMKEWGCAGWGWLEVSAVEVNPQDHLNHHDHTVKKL